MGFIVTKLLFYKYVDEVANIKSQIRMEPTRSDVFKKFDNMVTNMSGLCLRNFMSLDATNFVIIILS